MTDTDAAAPANGASPATAQIRILTQFIRDLSFENPRAPDIFRATSQPEIELGVEMNARGRPDGLYEADLKLTAVAKHDNQTTFHLELLYGGLFEIQGVPEDQIEMVLMIECPRYLFPFARRVISDITSDGGFPPFQLEPFDFAAIYEARKQGGQGLGGEGLGGQGQIQ